ncbi:NmrA family NAD(P)-binding protein [Peristeroidobacter agariperforans]|uniref:NmrA family NAD(P)-binding protein n=1 Tax=Peristeroidobacter agariperforans TaxID=268404 RepID=UPI00101D7B7A|nr:NmrA family NAD(P)-binding protein [Peristeroidobacter agariperforans]
MNTAIPNILVLGGTGRVGSHLLRHLESRAAQGKVNVFAACRRIPDGSSRGGDSAFGRQVRFRHFDFDRLDTYASALAGIDRLFLLTGYTVAMLEHSKNLIDMAQVAGVSHIVHLGTFHPPGGPASRGVRHFVWHQLVESYIEHSGLSFTHLNPNTFMQNCIGAVDQHSLRMFFADQRIGLVDCKDVAEIGALSLLEPDRHAGKRYFLSTEALTMEEAAAVLSQELGRAIKYQPLSPAEVRSLPLAGLIERSYFECIVDIAEKMQRAELPDFSQTTTDFELASGHAPTSFREFVRREIDAFAA